MSELAMSVVWEGDYSARIVTADDYPGYRVRIERDDSSQDALDSQAMSAVVRFDRGTAKLHTGCGDELDVNAIGRWWKQFEGVAPEKLTEWLVNKGEAYAVEVVQTPGFNSWGFLVAATPQWVREIWTPDGEETTPYHVAQAKAALAEEAATVAAWIEGEVFTIVPEEHVTITETAIDPAGRDRSEVYDEWRTNFGYGPVGGHIGDAWSVEAAKELLAEMIQGELNPER